MTLYLDVLRELSEQSKTAAMPHVVPGNMVLESGRMYTTAKDSPPAGGIDYDATNHQACIPLPSPVDTSSTDLNVKLTIEASTRELTIHFRFFRAGRSLCSIGPANLVDRLARASFSVYCPRRRCLNLAAPLTSVFTLEGEGRVYPEVDLDAGRLVIIRQLQGNSITRCLTTFQNGKYAEIRKDAVIGDPADVPSAEQKDVLYHENVILRSEECWSCCIEVALSHPPKKEHFLPVVYIL